MFFNGRDVKVLGYSGNYVYVKDVKTQNVGYIHKLLLDDKPLNIKQKFLNIYSGDYKEGSITVNYEKGGTLEWSISSDDVVEITKHNNNSLSVKGLRPGTVTLTVKCGNDKDKCEIFCINKWTDIETAVAQSDIKVVTTPEETDAAWSISQGSTITARGNVPDKQNYLYVSSGNNWGYIKITDFPSIKYLLNMYHCYDQGYNLRFGSASTKIYSYTSVLNDVMMDNFGLKVCPFVESYTSVADQCKILQFGSVKSSNLSSSCPKNGKHIYDSCLKTLSLRTELSSKYIDVKGNVAKVAWTGHNMSNIETDRSNSSIGLGSIIMTPYGTEGVSTEKIREDRVFTLVHETSHQLSLRDHYCYGDISEITQQCSNPFCAECSGTTITQSCIMNKRASIEKTDFDELYCDECKRRISNYIKNF